ncbi:MAG: sigma-70 family RNA polymerase sigma factor [Clostridia bacterium]|nr:sigma-70 family RNA polymerase sigma factor [Clostridia bacterium]
MSEYSSNTAYIEEAQQGNEQAAEELIKKNYPLAVSLARRFSGRGVDTEDLIQLALIGMLKAIRTFDLSRGTAFSTYAVPLIMGEIRKFLRDDGLIKVSRENKKNGAVILHAREEFQEKHGREPHIEELCSLTGLTKEEVCDALNSSKPVASLFEPIGNNEGYTVENSLEDLGSSIDSAFDRIALSEALKKLPKESQKLIILRYFKDMSQQRTAEIMGLSQVKVSRKEKKIIEELRKSIV